MVDPTAVKKALADGPWDWIIFTSRNGVSATKEKLFEAGLDTRAFGNAKIAVVGESTADSVRDELSLKVDLCPKQFVAEALADALAAGNEVRGKRFLLFRAEIARPVLTDRLKQGGGAAVRDVPIYQTRSAASLPAERNRRHRRRHGQLGHLHQQQHRKKLCWITRTRLFEEARIRETRQHRPGDDGDDAGVEINADDRSRSAHD